MGKHTRAAATPVEDIEYEVHRDAIIADGKYEAVLDQLTKFWCIWSKCTKLRFEWRVYCDPHNADVYEILEQYMTYDLPPGRRSYFRRAWIIAYGDKLPERTTRWPLKVFKGKRFRVRVETVEKDRDGDPLVGDGRYSKVAKILELIGKEGDDETARDVCPF
jgi:hypothetical protein